MSQELEVLKTVTRRLAVGNIPYMVTGSIAMNYYVVPRMTRDIDIVVELTESSVDQAVDLFQGDFYVDRDMIREAVLRKSMFNIIHNTFVIKVDFIVRKESEYRRTEFLRRKQVTIDGQIVSIVAPEDLILSKLDWAKDSYSEMQINDVRNLINGEQPLDQEYLLQWVNQLGLTTIYQKAIG